MDRDRKAIWKAALFTVLAFPVILIGFIAAIIWTALEVGWYKASSDLVGVINEGVRAVERRRHD